SASPSLSRPGGSGSAHRGPGPWWAGGWRAAGLPPARTGTRARKACGGNLTEGDGRLGAGVAARDVGDALHAPHRPDDLVQVALVLDLDEDAAEHRAVPGRQLGTPDVGPRLADRLADVRVQSAPVLPAHAEPPDERPPPGLRPLH